MKPAAILKTSLAAVLALATLAAAAAALVALNAGGAARIGAWRPLEIAAGYDREAELQLARPPLTAAALVRAEGLTHRAIALNPYDTAAWLRLAYIDALRSPAMTAGGVAAFTRSYDLVAFDPYVASWRVRFALEHWAAMPPEVKTEVRAEALALGGEWKHREKIMQTLAGVRNPAARLTAALWASRIDSTVPK